MADLIKIDKSLIVKTPQELNEYLKPMSRDIFLFSSKIANSYRVKDPLLIKKLQVGEQLLFERKASKYEDNLIAITNMDKQLLGYVPEVDSAIFARLMEAGKMLFATIKNLDFSSSVPLISIDIFLRDY